MFALHGIHNRGKAFHIIRAFEKLDGSRRIALIDSLMSGSEHTFSNTVALLWPEASKDQKKTLARCILRRMAANDSKVH